MTEAEAEEFREINRKFTTEKGTIKLELNNCSQIIKEGRTGMV